MSAPAPELLAAAAKAPMLDPVEEKVLVQSAQTGDAAAMRRLVTSHMRLVLAVARRYSRYGVATDDLVGEGTLGLMEAISRFDVEKANRLSTYAAWWIRAYVRRFALANRRIIGVPSTRRTRKALWHLRSTQRQIAQAQGRPAEKAEVAEALGISVDEVDVVEAALGARDVPIGPYDAGSGPCLDLACETPDPEQVTADNELLEIRRDRVRDAMDRLSDREQEVVCRRLMDDERPSLNVLGEHFGVSRERVRQIQKNAEQKLRSALREVA